MRMNAAVVLCGLLGLVLSQAARAEKIGTIPVKPLPRAQSRSVEPAVPSQKAWVSLMTGLATADDAALITRGFGAYVGTGGVLAGARARFNVGFADVRHGRELGLMFGRSFGRRDNAWWALGVSRFEIERREPERNGGYDRGVIGVPLEIVFAPHWRNFGFELRGEANLNAAYPQLTLGAGLSFGQR